jgi:hypothetical protein
MVGVGKINFNGSTVFMDSESARIQITVYKTKCQYLRSIMMKKLLQILLQRYFNREWK